jgi:hypothetical protein
MRQFALLLASSILLSSCAGETQKTNTVDVRKVDTSNSRSKIAEESEEAQDASSNDGVKVVENEIELDQHKLAGDGRRLLAEKKYDELDAMIDQMCKTKQSYSNGRWHVDLMYMEFCDPIAGKKASDDDWKKLIADLEAWAKARPKSANARIAVAEAYVGYAWKARGGGFADKVTKEGWNLMDARQKQASQYLSDAEALQPINPRHWAVALIIGLGSHMEKSKYQSIVNDALQKEPGYVTVLLEQINYLQPRWYGEEDEWLATATKAADQLKGDAADERYSQLLWSAHSQRGTGNLFKEQNADYSRAKKGFEILLTKNPKSLAVISRYCAVAVQGGDKGEASKLFAKLDGKMTKSAWRSKKYFTKYRDWAGPPLEGL